MLVWGWQGREGTHVCVCCLLACGRLAEMLRSLLSCYAEVFGVEVKR